MPINTRLNSSFTAIGPGWAPAVINSYAELRFLIYQQRILPNAHSYWIGGSTAAPSRQIQYRPDYMPNVQGNKQKHKQHIKLN